MAPCATSFRVECSLPCKQLKKCNEQRIYGPIFNSDETNTRWCLQIEHTQPNQLNIGVCLMGGAPCTLQSYTIYIKTNEEPPEKLFIHTCDVRRDFPYDEFCWGFKDFCSRRSLKRQHQLICDKQTKTVCICCEMVIVKRSPSTDAKNEDLQFSTALFSTRTLDEWISFLKGKTDFPRLNNRVNEEIEKCMGQCAPYS